MTTPTNTPPPESELLPLVTRAALQRYLAALCNQSLDAIELLEARRLGAIASSDIKGYGYGKPLLVHWRIGDIERKAVLATVSPGGFGHQRMADRAAAMLWNHAAFNSLPGHVRSLDVGGIRSDGELQPLGSVIEFFQLVDFAEGAPYADDLIALLDGGDLTTLDRTRCDVLADYLLTIHREHGPADPTLYRRHVRELVGHSECLMGLVDSYPAQHSLGRYGLIDQARLERIEHACVRWRWRLHDNHHRLRRRHGDFHPWNLLFRPGTSDLSVLDHSRGEFGDPADDVISLALNYAFFALQREGRVTGPFGELYQRFLRRYLDGSGDEELFAVAAPYIAFRGVVMASPIWYPNLDEAVRAALFALVERVLAAERFDWEAIDDLARP
jgi:hypothetical protein